MEIIGIAPGVPRKVKAIITRTVTELAIVTLDRDGYIDDIDEILEERSSSDEDVLTVVSVLTMQ